MEALIAIFAEILFALAYPLLSALAGFFALSFELVVRLFGLVFGSVLGRKRDKRAPLQSQPASSSDEFAKPALSPAPHRRSAKWLHWIAAPLIVLGLGIVTLNYAFFPKIVDFVLTRVEGKTGYEIAYKGTQGDLFRGRVSFEGLEVTGGKAGLPRVDLLAQEVRFDANIWTLLSRDINVQTALIDTVRGTVALPDKDPEKPKKPREERRGFDVDQLDLTDIQVDVELAKGSTHSINLVSVRSRPMRSRIAAFDVFFRSSLVAEIDGASLKVTTSEVSENRRQTKWRLEGLEMAIVGALFPRAPFIWMSDGTVSAQVDDTWDRTGKQTAINMAWRVALEDAKIDPLRAEGTLDKSIALAAAGIINRRNAPFELAFDLALDEGDLQTSASGDLKALGSAVADGFLLGLAPELGEGAQTEGEAGSGTSLKRSIGERLKDKIKREFSD